MLHIHYITSVVLHIHCATSVMLHIHYATSVVLHIHYATSVMSHGLRSEYAPTLFSLHPWSVILGSTWTPTPPWGCIFPDLCATALLSSAGYEAFTDHWHGWFCSHSDIFSMSNPSTIFSGGAKTAKFGLNFPSHSPWSPNIRCGSVEIWPVHTSLEDVVLQWFDECNTSNDHS